MAREEDEDVEEEEDEAGDDEEELLGFIFVPIVPTTLAVFAIISPIPR